MRLMTTFREISCDDARLLALLRTASLPVEDLCGPQKRYWSTSDAGRGLVAAGGLEAHGTHGILRSCVVAGAARRRGLGTTLVEFLVAQARAAGMHELYLLTETAQSWFIRLGFEAVERARVPPAIAVSSQFAGVCPASAAALKRTIRGPS
jgi:N-acetylglutamate synthase-like GNAT family acetyltransferase